MIAKPADCATGSQLDAGSHRNRLDRSIVSSSPGTRASSAKHGPDRGDGRGCIHRGDTRRAELIGVHSGRIGVDDYPWRIDDTTAHTVMNLNVDMDDETSQRALRGCRIVHTPAFFCLGCYRKLRRNSMDHSYYRVTTTPVAAPHTAAACRGCAGDSRSCPEDYHGPQMALGPKRTVKPVAVISCTNVIPPVLPDGRVASILREL